MYVQRAPAPRYNKNCVLLQAISASRKLAHEARRFLGQSERVPRMPATAGLQEIRLAILFVIQQLASGPLPRLLQLLKATLFDGNPPSSGQIG